MKRIISLILIAVTLIALMPAFTALAVEYVVYNDFEQHEIGDDVDKVSSYSCKFAGMVGSRFEVCYPPRSFSKGLKIVSDARTESSCTANITMYIEKTGIVTFSMDIMPFDKGTMNISISDRANGGRTIAVMSAGNITPYNHLGGSMTALSGMTGSYKVEEWNQLKIIVNTAESTYGISVNGKII